MPSAAFTHWLKAKRRNTLLLSALYAVLALVGGVIVLLPTFLLIYLAAKIVVFLVLPMNRFVTAWSWGLAVVGQGLIFADCIWSEREDMSVLPRWLVREVLHAGPRLAFEGGRQGARAWGLLWLDIDMCADVLSYLASRKRSASREELLNAFPELVWPRLIAQLRLLDGVLFLRADVSRLSLTSTLRVELRNFVVEVKTAEDFQEEVPPVPVDEPEKLAPCEILGVAPDASLAEIKIAYRSRVKECHPDRFAGADAESLRLAEEWTKSLNAAYESLVAQSRNGTATRN